MKKPFSSLRYDLPASIVVFLVAVPLCLGIAVASGVPPVTGLLSGIIGGIIVGAISGSSLSVTGPAAGLISTVALIIADVPVFEAFILSVLLAGLIQVVLGTIKAGIIVNFVPVSVLNGMLVAIGLLLILKQFPHLVGYDHDFVGDEALMEADGSNTFKDLKLALAHISPLASIIGLLGLTIQFFWDSKLFPSKKLKLLIPGPLAVVFTGIGINQIMIGMNSPLAIQAEHMVNIPVLVGIHELTTIIRFPDFSYIGSSIVWIAAFKIAIIASIESLLSVEASDKLDEKKRITNVNRELIAQGAGNITAGLIGALPVTSVIVRSSANIYAGAKSKLSTILHGTIILLALFLFPRILNLIPLSALAAILIYTGLKLANPKVFSKQWKIGFPVFIPFVVTIVAILLSDLLYGVCIGILVGIYYIIRSNFHQSFRVAVTDNNYLLKFGSQVSFLNKIILKNSLENIPNGARVLVDFSSCNFMDHDIAEMIKDFSVHCRKEQIELEYKFLNDDQKQQLKIQTHGVIH
ncbi:MAG: SulP family inorganic anion transporter [Bacteroidetes bacterium]|nr:SulP family inorganic anion transporter [Bacteroidota bacterium]